MPDNFLIALEDIRSDRTAAERVLAIIVHELRNPLAAILSSVELLRMPGVEGSEAAELIETIEERSRAMARLLDDIAQGAQGERSEAKQQFSRRVAVVDDDVETADALVLLLGALGSPARGLYSAESAIAYLENNDVDILFLDIGMPGMDGYELVRNLRANGHRRMSIIALTGYGADEDREHAFRAGFTRHLTKPVKADELREILSLPMA